MNSNITEEAVLLKMFAAILEGLEMGLLLSMMIGPVFFALVNTSLDHGFKQSAILAFGVFLSDLVYVLVTYFGVQALTFIPNIEWYLGFFGGLILIGIGVSFFRKKITAAPSPSFPTLASQGKALLQGFGINGINPFVMLFWISIASMVSIKSSWGISDRAFFYAALLFTVFGFDLGKAFLAEKLAHLVSLKVRKALQVFAGLMVCFFGLRMLWSTLHSVL
ncbi:MAG: LysE family translocator [Algoriphagus sp.]|jgi:threonine/homoserine/homoserine lactone efflux protein